jgi:hypothetical protein
MGIKDYHYTMDYKSRTMCIRKGADLKKTCNRYSSSGKSEIPTSHLIILIKSNSVPLNKL